MAKRRTLETTAFGVRVFDTYGISEKPYLNFAKLWTK